ncbi:hypothetical protein ACFQDN_26665 [Pseudomonas asuensis]|uniref:hypothetical protein n=1 Tax=Pseudomonas asuensis TaxID=1825787 RepID=UPI0027E4D2B4|nr:hypothetical protein [Pseudomonas asuensis]
MSPDNRLKAWKDLRLTYDAWGNVSERHNPNGYQRFTYDCENRLVKAETYRGHESLSQASLIKSLSTTAFTPTRLIRRLSLRTMPATWYGALTTRHRVRWKRWLPERSSGTYVFKDSTTTPKRACITIRSLLRSTGGTIYELFEAYDRLMTLKYMYAYATGLIFLVKM